MDLAQFRALADAQLSAFNPIEPVLLSIREGWYRTSLWGPKTRCYAYAAALNEWPEPQAGAYGALQCAGPEYFEYPELAIDYVARQLRAGQPVPRYSLVAEALQVQPDADRAAAEAITYAKEEGACSW